MMNPMIRLLIVDDYPVILTGLTAMLGNLKDIQLVGSAASGKKAVELANDLRPDVVLMNLNMPEMDGVEATRAIKKAHPEIHILIFSGMSSSEKVIPVLNAGAIGFILKDAGQPEIVQAVQQVAGGKAWLHPSVVGHMLRQINANEEKEDLLERLTERELDVLRYMAQGNSNHEIARLMVVSGATVHSHVSHILSKLEVSSRTQAVIYAMRFGILPPAGDFDGASNI
jgi:DNA-binding NarL/FixJ family response regulator